MQFKKSDSFEPFRNHTAEELALQAENPQMPLKNRILIGELLALQGDPRIQPLQPNMIQIPGGETKIGLPAEKLFETWKNLADSLVKVEWIAKEVPQHYVTIDSFKIAKYPITHFEYLTYLNESGEKEIPTSWNRKEYPASLANHPVNTVTPGAAERYCKWLSERTGRTFRLPTEAEWEYVSSGSNELEYPWGNQFNPDHANTLELGIKNTTPVGIFPAGNTIFGVCDLAGNVEEIVSDFYAPYPGGIEVVDQFAEKHGQYRMTRGGSFNRHRDVARSRRRHGWYPETQVIGFRIAETA